VRECDRLVEWGDGALGLAGRDAALHLDRLEAQALAVVVGFDPIDTVARAHADASRTVHPCGELDPAFGARDARGVRQPDARRGLDHAESTAPVVEHRGDLL